MFSEVDLQRNMHPNNIPIPLERFPAFCCCDGTVRATEGVLGTEYCLVCWGLIW